MLYQVTFLLDEIDVCRKNSSVFCWLLNISSEVSVKCDDFMQTICLLTCSWCRGDIITMGE